MTRDEILNLTGPALSEMVHQTLFGVGELPVGPHETIPQYHENTADAWVVVEKMAEKGKELTLLNDIKKGWAISFDGIYPREWTADFCVSICHASLLAVFNV